MLTAQLDAWSYLETLLTHLLVYANDELGSLLYLLLGCILSFAEVLFLLDLSSFQVKGGEGLEDILRRHFLEGFLYVSNLLKAEYIFGKHGYVLSGSRGIH